MLQVIRIYAGDRELCSWMEDVLKQVYGTEYTGLAESEQGSSLPVSWASVNGIAFPENLPFDTGRWILSSPFPPEETEPPLPADIAAYIPVNCPADEAAAVIKTVLYGWDVFRAEGPDGNRELRTRDDSRTVLSAQEWKVLQYMAAGEPNKSIASILSISESTVKFHINSIFTKLDARNRAQAVYEAMIRGMIAV